MVHPHAVQSAMPRFCLAGHLNYVRRCQCALYGKSPSFPMQSPVDHEAVFRMLNATS